MAYAMDSYIPEAHKSPWLRQWGETEMDQVYSDGSRFDRRINEGMMKQVEQFQ